MSWQSIETAPKGDEFIRILATGPHRRADPGDPYVVDIIVWGFHWAWREESAGDDLYRKVRYRANAGWRRHGDNGDIPVDFEPVMWMPLPAPPMNPTAVNQVLRGLKPLT